MTREKIRRFTSLVFLGFGGWLIYLGNEWTINGAPIWIVGVIVVVFGISGLLGANIFQGGPLDKNNDPK